MATARTAKKWGDTLADMEAGERNPRALTVELAGHMKRSLSWMAAKWGVSSTTYDVVNGNSKWRTRRPDEFPENDPAEWVSLAETARVLAYSARQLEDFAERQRAAAEQRLIDGGK